MGPILKVAAFALFVGGFAGAAAPWRVSRAAMAGALAGGIAGEPGLRAVMAGPVTFKLLPRPRLQARDLSLTAGDGAVTLDAPALKAELDIPSLLRGAWRISAATLVAPTVRVDVERLMARRPAATAGVRGWPLTLHLRSGLLSTRSAAGFPDLLATGIDATVAWSGDGEDLVVSGLATVRGTTAQFAGALQHPGQSLTPAGSAASVQVTSPVFDFAADGVLSGGSQEQFAGHASLSTAALPRLLGMLDGMPPSPMAKRAQVSGDLVARPHDLSLSNAQLRLDKARFEGTLAWRRDGGRGLVAGTLATDLFDLDALSGGKLDAARLAELYREPPGDPPLDIDLRISATTAKLGRGTLEDAAFAALVRGKRLELTLDEARAYGGLVKARAIATMRPGGLDAHADLSVRDLDLARLSEGLDGSGRVGGAMTAHVALDGRGASLREVVEGLDGEGQIGVERGRLPGLSLAQALRRLGRRSPPEAEPRSAPTTFDAAAWDVAVHAGVARISDGRLTAKGVALTFAAETALRDGRVDVHGTALQTDGSGAGAADGRSLPFDVRGSWSGPLVLVGHGGGPTGFTLPLIDGLAAAR